MGAVLGPMSYVLDKSWETARLMGAERWINYVLEKSKEFVIVLQHFGKISLAKVEEVCPVPLQHFAKLCMAKLQDEVFPPLINFGNICMAKVDEVFPPETRAEQMKHWVQVATPYIIATVVIWILLRFFRGGGGGPKAKMMIAPGTGRALEIPRSSFEASPREYFRELRRN